MPFAKENALHSMLWGRDPNMLYVPQHWYVPSASYVIMLCSVIDQRMVKLQQVSNNIATILNTYDLTAVSGFEILFT